MTFWIELDCSVFSYTTRYGKSLSVRHYTWKYFRKLKGPQVALFR